MGDLKTVRLFFETIGVIRALTGLGVEQIAGDIGENQFVGIFIDQLVEAAFSATIAEGFPFGFIHLLQTLGLPKGGLHHTAHLLHLIKRVVIPLVTQYFKGRFFNGSSGS